MVADAPRRTYRTELDREVDNIESIEAWRRVRVLGIRMKTAVVAERLDVVDSSAGELIVMSDRKLRQLDPRDAA